MKTRTTAPGRRPGRNHQASSIREEVAPSMPATRWWQVLKDPIFLLFVVGSCVVAAGLWWKADHLYRQLAETLAADQARSYALALKRMDIAYGMEVGARPNSTGEANASDPKKKSNPPLTFSELLATSMGGPGEIQSRFHSLEDAPGKDSVRAVADEFVREAGSNVATNPETVLTRSDELLGEPTLRYATGWADGERKRVLEILVPLKGIMASSAVYGKVVAGFFVGVGLLGMLAVALSLGKARRGAMASGLRVSALETECAKQKRTLLAYQQEDENRKQHEAEILRAVGVLASVTKDLQQTSGGLTSSAAEMAAAVNETTTAVEEVKQTAALSSQKARQVAASAQEAAQTSQVGKQATEDTITEMRRIRDQMQAIAESIVHLSEQSHTIREIIDTVNDLAEQSNVLAVNASIEAQKAGVQGSGFAIVAQEVRSLAQQSKDATAQVQAILNDIEKATGAAVQMTARGAKATEAGMTQAVEACESIRALAQSIQEATQNAAFIATSNQQQAVGMDQLAQAMLNIQEGSEHAVASSQHVSGCVRQLQELGQQLASLGQHLASGALDAEVAEAA